MSRNNNSHHPEARQDLSSTSIEIGFPSRDPFREDIIDQMVNEDNPQTEMILL